MLYLASPAVHSNHGAVSDIKGSSGFEAIQRTLLSCVRTVQNKAHPGGADPGAVLDTAFFSRSFSGRDLEEVLDRTIDVMRPKLRAELTAFREAEEARSRANKIADRDRGLNRAFTINVEGNLSMPKYEFSGGTYGAVGDNARVDRSVIGGLNGTIAIGSQQIQREALLDELSTLLEEVTSAEGALTYGDSEALKAATEQLALGNDDAAIQGFRKLGKWVVDTATTIGTTVAAAALKGVLDLS